MDRLIGPSIRSTNECTARPDFALIPRPDAQRAAIKGSGFVARRITFRNTAGPGGFQAVALKAMGDRAAFDACSFEGYQDTLYALALRHFYAGCVVYGTIDFVFGDAAAVFQGTRLVLRQPLPKQFNTVTAHGRADPHESTGFSFQGCAVAAADAGLAPGGVVSYLGRPWRPYSRTVFLQCEIGAAVSPLGWVAWDPAADPAPAAVFYGEFQNSGAGSDTSRRVAWPGVHSALSIQQAEAFTVASLISGSSWLPSAQVAFQESL
jgi:pectinesterase